MNNNNEYLNICLLKKQIKILQCNIYIIKKLPKKIYPKKVECLTLDNIFHCNERNRWYYQVNDDDRLYVSSIVIGYDNIIEKYKTNYINMRNMRKSLMSIDENLKIKHYIKIGENCPICLDKILHKSNAFLTRCGHSFHYSCIRENENTNWGKNNWGHCPICRQETGESDGIKEIYCNSDYILDKLENFWDNITTIIPEKCHNDFTNIHDLGMKNGCLKCIKYRQTEKI